MAEGGTGQLRVRRSANSEESIYLPNITSIEATISAQLTEIPTIVFGVDNNFVMDLGTYKTYTITVERATPNDYNDASSNPEDWSNGKWYTFLEKFWDFWQNMTYGKDGKLLGGIHFEYFPGDEGGYPYISENVFLQGSLSASFSVQRLKVSMTLLVARVGLDENEDVDSVEVRFIVDTEEYSKWVTEGAQIKLGNPEEPYYSRSDKVQKGYIFKGWSYNDVTYKDTIIEVVKGMVFEAVWGDPPIYQLLLPGEEHEIEVPGGVNMCQVIVIGGGGTGGKHDSISGQGFNQHYYSAGGGGGSGEKVTRTFKVEYGDFVYCHVGAGGKYYSDPKYKAKDGEASTVDYGSLQTIIAHGGLQGAGGSGDIDGIAYGGQQYVKGGDAGPGFDDSGKGGDGDPDGVSAGISGKGASNYNQNTYFHYQGGCGGGAANINGTYRIGVFGATIEKEIISTGGDGAAGGDPSSGTYGGGGGSSTPHFNSSTETAQGGAGDGGDGLILITFYQE